MVVCNKKSKFKTNIPTIDCQPGPVGVVRSKVIGDNTLVRPLISEVDIREVQHGGIDEFSFLISGIVFHFCVVKHLPVLPPRSGHWGVAAAGCNAVQRHVDAP